MTRQINSTSNQLIKTIKKLRNKKSRDELKLFYVEGVRAVGEAIETKQDIRYLLFCPGLLVSEYGNQLIENYAQDGDSLIEVSEEVFQSFSLKEGPQGLAAVVSQKWSSLDQAKNKGGLWTALDSIQDPGNLGTILRSSDAVGGRGVILLDQTTDPFHPSSVRASTGAIFTQEIIQIELKNFIEWKSNVNIPVLGTLCGDAANYRDYHYPSDIILLMGSEQKGLNENHLGICDAIVTIPMEGNVDSLNVSVAASIILFEIYHQKKMSNDRGN